MGAEDLRDIRVCLCKLDEQCKEFQRCRSQTAFIFGEKQRTEFERFQPCDFIARECACRISLARAFGDFGEHRPENCHECAECGCVDCRPGMRMMGQGRSLTIWK